jgi:hypothetical protein
MAGNIVTHERPLKATSPHLVTFEVRDTAGRRRLCAVATGLVTEQFAGARHSLNHSIEIAVALPFRPAEHTLTLGARGFEIRRIPLFSPKRIGWSIVDHAGEPTEAGLTIIATVWVNHAHAVSFGVSYHVTALSAPLDPPEPAEG